MNFGVVVDVRQVSPLLHRVTFSHLCDLCKDNGRGEPRELCECRNPTVWLGNGTNLNLSPGSRRRCARLMSLWFYRLLHQINVATFSDEVVETVRAVEDDSTSSKESVVLRSIFSIYDHNPLVA